MIIGIDASRANKKHKTGTEWYSYYLIKSLAQLDGKNKYILYANDPLRSDLADLSKLNPPEEKNYIPNIDKKGNQKLISKYGNFSAKILRWPFRHYWTQARLSWEMLINKPDVLFVPSHALPVIHPRKSVVTIHDIGFVKNNKLYSTGGTGIDEAPFKSINKIMAKIMTFGKYTADPVDYLKWSTSYAIKRAWKIITVSDFSKNEIIKYYHPTKNNIIVIHNGYNCGLYKKIDDKEKIQKVLDKYGIDGPYLFYLGRIEKKKNSTKLIEAFAILRQNNKDIKHKLVLVGNASNGYDEVNYLIKEFGLDNEVIITGWMDELDVPYIYNGCTAFIFPSNYEGFGLPLIQAMACQTPVAASGSSSIPEVVNDAALFFNPSNAEFIAKAMESIIVDEDIRKKLIEKGKKRATQFSWEKCAQKTLDVLVS